MGKAELSSLSLSLSLSLSHLVQIYLISYGIELFEVGVVCKVLVVAEDVDGFKGTGEGFKKQRKAMQDPINTT